LLDFARSAPNDTWAETGEDGGWSAKDILAHLAGDTGKYFAHLLGAVLRGENVDPSRLGPYAKVDAINARDVADRREQSVQALIQEIEEDGRIHLEQLARLTEDDRLFEVAPYGLTLGEFLGRKPPGDRANHDLRHLDELRHRR
jgi:hypothetical protein